MKLRRSQSVYVLLLLVGLSRDKKTKDIPNLMYRGAPPSGRGSFPPPEAECNQESMFSISLRPRGIIRMRLVQMEECIWMEGA